MGTREDFLSLNGPDNVGKTTQLRLLAACMPTFQMLGSVHEHDPEPWAAVARDDYSRWWFRTSSTAELTRMLLSSHAKRVRARAAGHTGLLDRGRPMLEAVAAATYAVKQGENRADMALAEVEHIAAEYVSPPEHSILLIPSLDPDRSYAICETREGRQWTDEYPAYQRNLHRILLRQAEKGTYVAVVDCERRTIDEVHAEVLKAADCFSRTRSVTEGPSA